MPKDCGYDGTRIRSRVAALPRWEVGTLAVLSDSDKRVPARKLHGG
jgi:hypothetical protein